LLRIAPANALTLGRVSSNLFNNARHIAPVEVDNPVNAYNPTINRYISTYARNGNIAVSYPVETPTTTEKRHADTPKDSIVDASGNCENPSIAYSKRANKIGLVYSSFIEGAEDSVHVIRDTNIIWYQQFRMGTPYSSLFKHSLDTVIVVRTADPFYTAPAIVPTNDTAHAFWVTWRAETTLGGLVGLVDTNGHLTSKSYFSAGTPSTTKFISPASHTGVANAHMVWEEYGAGGLDYIYYRQATYNGGFVVSTNSQRNISSDVPLCHNHHPQIATDVDGNDHVVWEIYDAFVINAKPRTTRYGGATIQRERDDAKNKWGSVTEFMPLSGGLRVSALSPVPYDVFPNIASVGSAANIDSEAFYGNNKQWLDFQRITWNNTTSNRIDLVHYGFNTGFRWSGAMMLEKSLEPAMPECSFWLVVPHAMLFRSPFLMEDGNFDAKITRYKFPNTPIAEMPNTQFKLTWKIVKAAPAIACAIMKGGLDNATIIHSGGGGSTPVGLQPQQAPLTDTSTSAAPIPDAVTLNDKRVRTQTFTLVADDTLRYRRFFTLDNDFDSPDTASLKTALTDSSDYLKMRVYLRKRIDSSVIIVLDTAMLKKAGYVRTGTNGDVEGQFIVPHGFTTDSAFITLEMIHGDTTNHFWNFSLTDVYAVEDIGTLFDESYKKSQPITGSPNVGEDKEKINVSIIPNPFNHSTMIKINSTEGLPTKVEVFDLLGMKIGDLFNGAFPASPLEVNFEAAALSAGSYLVRIQSGNAVETRKVELIK
jgi:hypothetical protein